MIRLRFTVHILLLGLVLAGHTLAHAEFQQPPATSSVLTNSDVIDLLKAGLTPEIVIAKIKSSVCNFDTSPIALKGLKAANVPDAVILAMVQAPAQSSPPSPSPLSSAPLSSSSPSPPPPPPPTSPGAPVVFFTDIVGGPNRGGEGNNGAFVHVYGKRFGAQRGNATVTVGGGEVASYQIWGQQNAVTKYLDLIVVQLGPNAKTGDLVVHTPNGDSNPVPFVVRPGNIYFVAPAGSDANPGTFDKPWATPAKAKKSIRPGDIVYFRAGTWTKEEDYATIVNLTVSGARDRPLAFVGYPGEVAFLDNADSTSAVYNWGPDVLSHWVLAEMKFRANYASLRFEGGATEDIRVIGCDISSTGNSVSMNVEHPAKMYRVYGNNMHDNGTGAKKAYSLYFGGYGAQSDIDIGWNELHDNPLGKGIQVYGHQPGDRISNLRIHDNVIYNNGMSGMVVGGNDGKTDFVVDASIYNNLIFKNGNRHPDWQYHGIELTSNSGKGSQFFVYNNTFYDNGAPHGRVSGGSEIHVNIGIGQAVFTNNIFYADAGAPAYYTYEYGATQAGMSGSNNVYFGKGKGPAWDTKPINADPRFVDPQNWDFHLKAGSRAIDAGLPTNATHDFDGNGRPYGSAFDIGAFEVAAGPPPASPPLPASPPPQSPDKTPPVVSISTPSNGAAVSKRSD